MATASAATAPLDKGLPPGAGVGPSGEPATGPTDPEDTETKLKKELGETQNTISEIEKEIGGLKNEEEEGKDALKGAENSKGEAQNARKERKGEADGLRIQREAAQKDFDRTQAEKDSADAKLVELRAEAENLRAENEGKGQEEDRELQELDRRIQDKVSNGGSQTTGAHDDVVRRGEVYIEQENRRQTLKKKSDDVEEQYDRLSGLSAKITDQKNNIENIKKQEEEKNREIGRLDDNIKRFDQEILSYRERIEKAGKEIKTRSAELDSQRNRILALETQIAESEEAARLKGAVASGRPADPTAEEQKKLQTARALTATASGTASGGPPLPDPKIGASSTGTPAATTAGTTTTPAATKAGTTTTPEPDTTVGGARATAEVLPPAGPAAIRSAPIRTHREATRDIALESAWETATQAVSFYVGDLTSQSISKNYINDTEAQEIMTYVIAAATTAVLIGSVYEDIRQSRKDAGTIDWKAIAGRVVAFGVPVALFAAAVGTGTQAASGLPILRAVITVMVNQAIARVVSLDKHKNPLNDNSGTRWQEFIAYDVGWTAASVGTGINQDYVTGTSGIAADDSFGDAAKGTATTAAVFGVVEGALRDGAKAVLDYRDEEHGRMIPPDEVARVDALEGDERAREERRLTKTNLKLGEMPKFDIHDVKGSLPGIAEDELWPGAKNLSKTVAFYGWVFYGLGLLDKVDADDPNALIASLAQAAIVGGAFAVGLIFFRLASLPIKKSTNLPEQSATQDVELQAAR